MKRILVLMTVALVMAALMVAMAMPAFAGSYDSHGCKKYSQGYKASNGKCFHKDKDKKDKKDKKKGYY